MMVNDNSERPGITCTRVLIEAGMLHRAEQEITEVLSDDPDDLTALNLFAKIKHIKGELSQAIACWVQLHARSQHHEIARLYFYSLFHLAKNPERHAADFVAFDGRAGFKPSSFVHLELQSAFELFHQGQTREAKDACRRLAAKQKLRDPRSYKLAVLAQSWMNELTGDWSDARALLEELGRVKEFAEDIDRVLALVRVYEALGDEKSLRSAVNICHYLVRSYAKMSALSRLVSIHRRLHEEHLAASHEAEFFECFMERMQVPSIEDVVFTAMRVAIPVEKLRNIRTTQTRTSFSTPLEKAVVAVVDGNYDEAVQLASEDESKHAKVYQADLWKELGKPEKSVDLMLALTKSDPDELMLICRLLDLFPLTENAEIGDWFRSNDRYEASRSRIEEKLRDFSSDPYYWNCLATLHRIKGNQAEMERCTDRSIAVAAAKEREEHPVGRAHAAAVYNYIGKSKGLIHEVWVSKNPVDEGRGGHLPSHQILGNLTTETRDAVANLFAALSEYLKSKFPHRVEEFERYDYSFKVTKEDEPSGGLSIGLPTALAFMSSFLNKPIPQSFAASGMAVSESHKVISIRRVGDIAYKIKGSFNRNLSTLLIPAENRPEVEQATNVPRQVVSDLVRYVSSLDEAIEICFGPDVWLD